MTATWSSPDRLVLDLVDDAPRGHRRWLLWPAWQFRVHAPVVGQTRMDVFQRAILRLCRAGVRRPELLGERLCLEPDLCEYVLEQLQLYGYLTETREPTRNGLDALATGELDPLDSVVVYVFQDPFTRQLWPSATDRLYPGEVVWRRGQPALVRGDAGDQMEFKCMAVQPPADAQPRKPEAIDVLQAVRRFKLPDREPADFGVPGDRTIRRVSFIDAQPEPVWLATYLFVDWRAKDKSIPWQARDPLGSGPSTMLRRLILARREEDERLRAVIDNLVGRRESARIEAAQQARAEVSRDAADWLDLELTLQIREHEEVHKLLVDMETSYRLGKNGSGGTEFETAARDALRAFEVVFRELLSRYPVADDDLEKLNLRPPNLVERRKREVRRLVVDQAKIVGITSTSDLDRLVNGNFSQVVNAARKPARADFQPSLPVLVLATRNRTDHPLARAARHRPDLIDTLITTARLRNPTAHERIKDLAQDEVEWVREAILSLLPFLLNLSTPVKEGTSAP
ncbi:hypothetical protein [Amycolatopsis sp. NPDC003861]